MSSERDRLYTRLATLVGVVWAVSTVIAIPLHTDPAILAGATAVMTIVVTGIFLRNGKDTK